MRSDGTAHHTHHQTLSLKFPAQVHPHQRKRLKHAQFPELGEKASLTHSPVSLFPLILITLLTLLSFISENSYLFIPPARYVFRGAELFEESPDDCDSSDWTTASDDSGSSDNSSDSVSSSCPSEEAAAPQAHDSSRVSSSEWIGDSEDSIFNAGDRET